MPNNGNKPKWSLPYETAWSDDPRRRRTQRIARAVAYILILSVLLVPAIQLEVKIIRNQRKAAQYQRKLAAGTLNAKERLKGRPKPHKGAIWQHAYSGQYFGQQERHHNWSQVRAHLLLDELWLDDVFLHYFWRDWGTRRERMFLHNVLRTWMDARDQQQLDGNVAAALRGVNPRDWLPFVSDEHLRTWRDWLVEQLGPGHTVPTAQVFARRMGVPAAEVEAVLSSPQQMEQRVFHHIPRAALQSFHDTGYERSVVLIHSYIRKFV